MELLHRFDESKAQQWNITYIKDAFKEHVNRYERLGTYTAPGKEKLDILIVHLAKESKLERARTAIRNFVADHLKNREEKDAALVAFVSPTGNQWRFSYVKMEYAAVEKESGKVGVETRLTPARRFSYLVGEDESCHTAQTRFLNLLQNTDKDPTLAELESAFSVEAVTKEFFTRYRDLFEEINKALEKLVKDDNVIHGEFKKKGVKAVDFSKKLLGQIVFLYFIQKKGWLGVEKGRDWGSGPRDFLRRLADGKHGTCKNFFNDILEPLFYDTLATERGGEAWSKRFRCRIPFLNGGLFEPIGGYDWEKTDIVLPNRLFFNTEPFEGDITGTGVLDVFDRYNFTVNEAEPLEKEVAIDPEMLGKVFENLIEDNRRKGLGAFYTPREIVHYMCQESLIAYLDTAVNVSTESVDPGTANQAKLFTAAEPGPLWFSTTVRKDVVPRDDIETLVRHGDQYLPYEEAKQAGTIGRDYPKPPRRIEQNARLIDDKLADITVCDPAVGSGAFPVGMMMEIVRARRALSPYLGDARERTAYHFKRHAIQNCLYGVDIDPSAVEIAKLRLWLSLVVDEENVKEIKPLPNLDYKIVAGDSLICSGTEGMLFKNNTLSELEELKRNVFEEVDHDRKGKFKERISTLFDEITEGKRLFDFEIYFSEVFKGRGGFDVTIGNPPYVRQEEIKAIKPELKKRFECYTGTADLFVYFYERAWKLLRPGGTHAFITSNKFLRSGYGEKLRGFLTCNTRILRLVDFGDAPVFEAIAYPCVLVFQKTTVNATGNAKNSAKALTWKPGPPLENFDAIFAEKSMEVAQSGLTKDGWHLESPAVLRLLEKLRRAGTPLGEYVNGRFYYGIKTGFNEAFIVDRATRDRLIREHKSSAEILKPFLRGRDVKRWRVEPQDLWLIFTRRGIDISKYPAIQNHLLPFKKQLMPGKPGGRKPGSYEWYEIQDNIAYWQEFEQTKILYPDIYEHQSFTWDESGCYAANTCYFIPTKEKWLVALMNSQAVEWFYSNVSNKVRGGYLRAFSDYMKQIPIPSVAGDKQKSVEHLVDRILSSKRKDAEADVGVFEKEIDQIVYEHYGLTGEEIRLVEGSGK
ncbi:MAG: TaqI-like C-terminal specificity domain-containing protein [Planctomycetota bacterium]